MRVNYTYAAYKKTYAAYKKFILNIKMQVG